MSSSKEVAPRRASRLGLYGPFVALAIAAAAWSFGWWWLKGETERGLDAAAAHLASAGGDFTWQGRQVRGYPFRLDVDFQQVAWREASGWALAAPTLKTEASVFAPGHWVAVAPGGAVLTRPQGGAVRISAKVLRASVSDLALHPPTFSLEGIGLEFAPAAGASPYFLQSADEIHLHTRAGPADEGAYYVELDRATFRPESALGRIAGGKRINVIADGAFSRASALVGQGWAQSVQSWIAAGGQAALLRLHLAAGTAILDAHGAGLTVGPDGRLDGALDATLVQGSRALAALAAAGVIDPAAARLASAVLGSAGPTGPEHETLTFQAGRTTLGPVALAAAPKVY